MATSDALVTTFGTALVCYPQRHRLDGDLLDYFAVALARGALALDRGLRLAGRRIGQGHHEVAQRSNLFELRATEVVRIHHGFEVIGREEVRHPGAVLERLRILQPRLHPVWTQPVLRELQVRSQRGWILLASGRARGVALEALELVVHHHLGFRYFLRRWIESDGEVRVGHIRTGREEAHQGRRFIVGEREGRHSDVEPWPQLVARILDEA